jgi:oligopeptide/dipeptide ABC transporter ATP-binding protein
LLIRLIEPDAGTIAFDGETIGGPHGISLREMRRQIQMVFQDSYASLNPRLTIEDTIGFAPVDFGVTRVDARSRARDLLREVGLDPAQFLRRYPHELSGGQRQRVNIARALALKPRLLILDEAVSALDKSVEAQVLNLLSDLKAALGLTYLFISHDLDVVQYISDRVLVMYLGKIVEIGPVGSIYRAPLHPYTRALLAARPSMDPHRPTIEAPIQGDPPNLIDLPSGCRFRTRCPFAEPVCGEREPMLSGAEDGHRAACHMAVPGSGHSLAAPMATLTRLAALGARSRVAGEANPSRQQRTGDVADAVTDAPVLSVRDLRVTFAGTDRPAVRAVDGISFDVEEGEALGLLGESGSGKTVTLRALMRLLPRRQAQVEGSIRLGGVEVMALDRRSLSDLRGARIAMIFQEPALAFDPVYTIGAQIVETIRRHDDVMTAQSRARELLDLVQIPSAAARLAAYPHELSGGIRQRAMIALALSCRPSILLADEPTTALDTTVQIQILLLLRRLQRELGLSIIFVTHDVGVATEISSRLAVMYAGRIVEIGPAAAVIGDSRHPYTRGLLASIVYDAMRGRRLEAIPGAPPDLTALPPGCAFAPRCRDAAEDCRRAPPEARFPAPGRAARCLRVASAAAAVAI